MLRGEAVIDRQHARVSRGCDAPSEMSVKVWRADDKGSAMQEQEMPIGFGFGGGDHIRSDPVGIYGLGPSLGRRVWNQALGDGHESPMLLDRQLAMVTAFDQPTQTGPDQLGSHTHLARYSLRSDAYSIAA